MLKESDVIVESPKSADNGEDLDRPRRSFYQKSESIILGGGAILLVLGVWQAFWAAGKISPLFFSGPSAIAKRFWDALLNGSLASDLKFSGLNFALGFVFAAVAGVVMGVIVGWYKRVSMLLGPFLNAFYATPRIAKKLRRA